MTDNDIYVKYNQFVNGNKKRVYESYGSNILMDLKQRIIEKLENHDESILKII